MKKIYLSLAALCVACLLQAQSLTPQVIASSGAYATNSSGSLSYTVGEMTMVQTFTTANNILTQGFQQPDDNLLGILDLTPGDFGSFVVYPNPAVDVAWFAYQFPEQGTITVTLYNTLGQKLGNVLQADYNTGNNVQQVNASALASGMYLLTLNFVSTRTKQESTISRKFQVIK